MFSKRSTWLLLHLISVCKIFDIARHLVLKEKKSLLTWVATIKTFNEERDEMFSHMGCRNKKTFSVERDEKFTDLGCRNKKPSLLLFSLLVSANSHV